MDPVSADTSELQPDWDLTPGQSPVFFWGTALVLLAFLITGIVRWRKQRALYLSARDSTRVDSVLAPGRRVVEGVVQHEQGEAVAVRVEIDQLGHESENSGSWSHRWTEIGRTVHARPFLLRHASGQTIRVEPTQDVLLIDEMDGVVLIDLTHRKRVAELVLGERVFVDGLLSLDHTPQAAGGGYRGGRGFVLRAPPSELMLLSSEPMGERFRRRARILGGLALMAGTLLAILPLINVDCLLLQFLGKRGEATVTRLVHQKGEDSDGNETNSYYAFLQADELRVKRTEEVSAAGYVKLKEGQRAPIRYVPSIPTLAELGPDATASGFRTMGFVFPIGGLLLLHLLGLRHTREWYEKKLIETGSGRLKEEWDRMMASRS